jgi:hypothetical protein
VKIRIELDANRSVCALENTVLDEEPVWSRTNPTGVEAPGAETREQEAKRRSSVGIGDLDGHVRLNGTLAVAVAVSVLVTGATLVVFVDVMVSTAVDVEEATKTRLTLWEKAIRDR